jgi:hypothetical protein
MVGDSVFPGQSVPAVMLSGLSTAKMLVAREAQKTKAMQLPIEPRQGEFV